MQWQRKTDAKTRRHLRNTATRQGAAAAELAILLPFLVLMFGVILDFSQIYYVTQILDNSASAGVLYASGTMWPPTSSSDPITAATNAACAECISLAPAFTASNVNVVMTATTASVTVNYDCVMITPILNPSGTVHLTRTIVINLAPTAGN